MREEGAETAPLQAMLRRGGVSPPSSLALKEMTLAQDDIGKTSRRRKCLRCGRQFVPAQAHHRYCPQCNLDNAPVGYTSPSQRPGVAARRHGGVWRGTDGRRPVTLYGDATSREIIQGMQVFLTDVYKQPTRISTILQDAGMTVPEIECLREQRCLNDFVLRFCPRLWEWLGTLVGSKAQELIINSYGLYGEERCPIENIAGELGITPDHAAVLRGWALKQIRDPEKQAE